MSACALRESARVADLSQATILVVDDDPYVREGLRNLLEFAGYTVREAADGKEALDRLQQQTVDVLLLDLELPRISGMDVLRDVVRTHHGIAVVIISGHGSIRAAVDTTRLGAVDFLEKPIDGERMLAILRDTLQHGRTQRLTAAAVAARYGLVGVSPAMQQVYTLIDRAASVTAKVLITGESGTGKELTARAIHLHGPRAQGAFVSVNCAAIPETLIESELFGHQKGAFTGAAGTHHGRFEQAQHGTLFLDEIGDMSLMTQARVLRALEDSAIQRVGGETPIPLDVRLIAATNRDLRAAIERGNFREDLFYRVHVIRIELPPLRARREDIAPLAEHLLDRICARNGVPQKWLGAAALAVLTTHNWPGNVRELQNALERSVVLTEADTIDAADVRRALYNPTTDTFRGQPTSLRDARDEFERAYVLATLRENGGHIQHAAAALGINRSHLWRKLRDLGIATESMIDRYQLCRMARRQRQNGSSNSSPTI